MVALHRSNSIHCPPFHTFVAWKYSLATHRHSRVTFPRVAACRCLYLEQLEIGSTRKRATGVRATAAAIPSITEAVGEERNRVLATMSRKTGRRCTSRSWRPRWRRSRPQCTRCGARTTASSRSAPRPPRRAWRKTALAGDMHFRRYVRLSLKIGEGGSLRAELVLKQELTLEYSCTRQQRSPRSQGRTLHALTPPRRWPWRMRERRCVPWARRARCRWTRRRGCGCTSHRRSFWLHMRLLRTREQCFEAVPLQT